MKADTLPRIPSYAEMSHQVATAEYSPPAQESMLKDVEGHTTVYNNTLCDSEASTLNSFTDPKTPPTFHPQHHQQPIQLPEDTTENLSIAAENVARALEDLANAHPSSTAGGEYRRKAKKFRKLAKPPKDKPRGVLADFGRGCVLIVVAPVALAGVVVYTTGLILEGTGLVLKGVGHQGKQLFRLGKRE